MNQIKGSEIAIFILISYSGNSQHNSVSDIPKTSTLVGVVFFVYNGVLLMKI